MGNTNTKLPLRVVPRSVEGLVERNCLFKHITHTQHIGHVPLVKRLVKEFTF